MQFRVPAFSCLADWKTSHLHLGVEKQLDSILLQWVLSRIPISKRVGDMAVILLAVKTLEVLKAVDGLLLLAAKMKPKDEMVAGLLAFMPWTSPRLVQR